MEAGRKVGSLVLTGPMKELSWCSIGPGMHAAMQMPVTVLHFFADAPAATADALRQAVAKAPPGQAMLRASSVELADDGVWLALEPGVVGTLADELPLVAPMPGDQLERLFRSLADGLGVFHDLRQAHGSPRPENIFRLEDGSLKLAPFSLDRMIRAAGTELDPEYTPKLPSMLLHRFEAPEDMSGAGDELSMQRDVYQIGATFYELATGVPIYPVEGGPAFDTY